MSEEKSKLEQATEALLAIQNYDLNQLIRQDLGPFNFEGALAPALRIVALFKRLPQEVLRDFPNGPLDSIRDRARRILGLFDQILAFDPAQANPMDARNSIISGIVGTYDDTFNHLHSWLSYSASKTTDFAGIANEGRQAIQAISDYGTDVQGKMAEALRTVADLEDQLRQSLSKQGVGKQAQYFENEARIHADEAKKWGQRTFRWAVLLTLLAIVSFFTHKIPWFAPANVVEAIQFIASKLVLFGVLTFMLVRSSRNFLSHKHNEVINRHKQNSLLTFNALVEAGATPDSRQTILNHAAASIYAVPESGYVRASDGQGGSQNMTLVELLPRATARIGDGS